jgi:hypothetical protein
MLGLETQKKFKTPHFEKEKWPSQKMKQYRSIQQNIKAINRTRLSYAYDSNNVVIFVTACGSIHEEVSGFVRLCPELCDVERDGR